MKRIMAILAMLMLVVPFANVHAIEGNYYVYGVGDEVNFYTYEGDPTGSRTIILSDEGADSKYVKTWVTGFTGYTSIPYAEGIDVSNGDITDFKNTPIYRQLLEDINANLKGMPYARDVENELGLITLDDLKTVFGATQDGDKYVIDVAKWGKTFEAIENSREGVYTETVEKTADGKYYVWVVKFPKNAEKKVTSITVEKVEVGLDSTPSESVYGMLPVVYLDKTYDCMDRENKENYACYSCGEEYVWTEVGTQEDTCKLVDKVKTQANCVKSPKTGVEEYFLEFALVAGICAVVLVAVKRKNLFRGI